MFKFLKKSFSDFTKKLKEDKPKEKKVEKKEEVKEEKKVEEEPKKEEPKVEAPKEEKKPEAKRKKEKFDKIFSDFETSLLENNIAYEVVSLIKEEIKKEIEKDHKKKKKIDEVLKSLIERIFNEVEEVKLNEVLKKKPTVILFVGTNGTGKTTSIAKFANYLKKKDLSCVLAASDTFRAAAIEQLETHASKLKVNVIKHKYGSDAAAVAFDAIEHAKAKNIDVVLIDTAGRQHANADLMDELAKVKRVAKPDLTILTVDMLTGNDAVHQAKMFNEKIGIDGLILSKSDADEKGGALISAVYITKKPVLFLGTGQGYDDFEEFDKDKIMDKLL
ncbi:MAG: signal recognition particle-docking protein FtsY [Candidatus Woesearchaeota archaeon]|nr:MAG: signal recognition particle-docking protein FtsY [Candidatus Woesearchaeota archaeon]